MEKRRQHPHLLAHAVLALAVLFAPSAMAEVSFGIEIQPRGQAIPAGDQATVKVRIASSQRISGGPQLAVEGGELDVQRGGVQQSSFIFGKNSRHDVTHSFGVRGAPGTYKIRAKVRDNTGQEFQSEAVVLRVRARTAAEKARDPELLLELEKTSAYVGEPVAGELVVMWKPGTRFRLERGNLPTLSGDGAQVSLDPEAFEGAPIDGNPTARFRVRVVPLRPGALALGGEFGARVDMPGATRRMRPMRFDLATGPTPLEVKPLPTEGRPPEFDGAVGSFRMTIGADPLSLQPGQPIALRLSISGQGNFESLSPPQPTRSDGWQFYKASPLEVEPEEDDRPGKLEFEQNIVPLVAQTQVPSFKLPVFDPVKEAYVNLITAPIPITMSGEATPPPTPAAETMANGAAAGVPAVDRPTAELGDILMASGTGSPRWAGAGDTTPLWAHPAFWWAQAVLAIALLGGALAGRLMGGGRTRAARPPGYQELLRAAEHAPAEGPAFYAAARRCLQAWGGRGEAELPEPLAAVEERHGYYQFANTATGPDPLPDEERQSVLDALRGLGG